MPTALLNLGKSFLGRFGHTEDCSELETAISNIRMATTRSTGPPVERIAAAYLWAIYTSLQIRRDILAQAQVIDAWGTVIKLLAEIVGPEQTIQRRHENPRKCSHFPTSAVATAFSLDILREP